MKIFKLAIHCKNYESEFEQDITSPQDTLMQLHLRQYLMNRLLKGMPKKQQTLPKKILEMVKNRLID